MFVAMGALSVMALGPFPDDPSPEADVKATRPPTTLTVGAGGLRTVAEAVGAAQPYDTILVGPGTYAEPVTIDKPLTLKGAGPMTVYTSMLTISSDSVTVLDCQFNGIVGSTWDTAGIITRRFSSSPIYDLKVYDCTFTGCRQGIFLFGAIDCVIDGSTFNNCTRGVTIRGHYGFSSAYGNTVTSCYFYDQRSNGLWDGEAIAINGSGSAAVYDNVIEGCLMEGNAYGVHIDSSTGNEVKGCTIKESKYYPLSARNIRGVLKVHDNTFVSNEAGLTFDYCTGFSFTDNAVLNNEGDVRLATCTDFTFARNDINRSSVVLEDSMGGDFYDNAFGTSDHLSFRFVNSDPATYSHSISDNNTVGGNPIYYFFDEAGPAVENATAGSIMFVGCAAPTVDNTTVVDGDGIWCLWSDDAYISATVTNCLRGMTVESSMWLTLEGCDVSASERGWACLNLSGSEGEVFDTALDSGTSVLDWAVSGGSNVSCYNTTYNTSRVDAVSDGGGELWAYNSLFVEVWDNGSVNPLPGVDVNVSEGADAVYATAHFGGADPATDQDGLVGPVVLLDRTYIMSNESTVHAYDLEVWTSIDAVWTESRGGLGMLMPRRELFEAWDIRAPATPADLVLVDRPELDAIDVSWDANTDDTLVYSVWWNTSGGWAWLLNVSAPTASCRIDTGLVNGTTYEFRVSAWDEVPLQSPHTGPASVLHIDALAPAAPTGLAAISVNGTNCTLAWDANLEPDLVGYRLYMNASGAGADGPWAEVTPAAGTAATVLWVQGLRSETDYHFRVTAFDESPNESPGSIVLRVRTLDITAPLAPLLDALLEWTNVAGLLVNGTAEPNTTVTVLVNGRVAGTGVAGADGRFSIAVTLDDGANLVAARATDGSGNVGPLSPEARTILDTLAPDAPVLDALPALTNVPGQRVGGSAEALSTVTVLVNGVAVGTAAAGEDGAFGLDVALAEGDNFVTAFATDRARNAGPRAAALKVVLDTIAPLAPVLTAPPMYVNVATLVLHGTAEPLSKVEVLAAGAVVATTNADAAGAFEATVTLSTRLTELAARATDAATNVGPLCPAVSVILDTEPPVARAGPDVGTVEETRVAFDGSGSTDNEGIATLEWTFTLAGKLVNLTGARVNYTFPDPVTVAVTLTVTDLAGNSATDTLDVTVARKNLPPTLTDGTMTPDKGTTDTDFTFTVTLTDPDGDNGTVFVYVDGKQYAMVPDPKDTDSTDGRRYTYTTDLGAGTHTYYFEGQDERGNAAGGASAGQPAQRTTSEITKHKVVTGTGVGILVLVIVLVVIAAIVAIALSRRGKR